MYLEIEAKLKVDSLDVVQERLIEQGASFVAERMQTDYYFDESEPIMARTDQALRLRIESDAEGRRCIVTYKGPKQVDDYKKRKEINLEVDDAEALRYLFDALGYHVALAFNKRRRVWQFADCEVALDELPLIGVFVEIEGPDSSCIARIQTALHLIDAPHVTDSYAALVAAALARRGSTDREVFL